MRFDPLDSLHSYKRGVTTIMDDCRQGRVCVLGRHQVVVHGFIVDPSVLITIITQPKFYLAGLIL